MASQIDAAQRRAAQAIFDEIRHGDEQHQAWLLEKLMASPALRQTRRDALEETAQVIRERAEFIAHDYDIEPIGELEWFERERIVQAAEDFITQLDRLAQEG